MNFLKKIFGSTKKEESKKQKDYRAKYLILKKGYLELQDEFALIKENAAVLLDERAILKFMLFAITVQCGNKLEISTESIKIAKDMQDGFDLETRNEENAVVCQLKRKAK